MRWHKSNVTGFSPYQVLFGPFLPIHLELPNQPKFLLVIM
jgi:hypothetical protein